MGDSKGQNVWVSGGQTPGLGWLDLGRLLREGDTSIEQSWLGMARKHLANGRSSLDGGAAGNRPLHVCTYSPSDLGVSRGFPTCKVRSVGSRMRSCCFDHCPSEDGGLGWE